MAEKEALVARWEQREPLALIARDFGVSPGQVSNIAIREFGRPPQRMKRRPAEPVATVEAYEAAPVEPELELKLELEPAQAEPDLAAIMAELVATRRAMLEMRREMAGKIHTLELAVIRLAAKKQRRSEAGGQLAWQFGHFS
jgi:hypothetical protein